MRELRNTIERAYILADRKITVDRLPQDLPEVAPATPGPPIHLSVGQSLAEAEKRVILATLDELGGNKRETARILGISPKTLYNRLSEYRSEDGASA